MTVAEELAVILREHPEAWVGAVGSDALYVPIPSSVPVDGHRRLQGRWALDYIAPDDREPLSERWRRLPDAGHVHLRVGLVGGGAAVFHLFDVVDVHGSIVLVALPDDDRIDLGAPAILHDATTTSRFARVLRDQSARNIEIDDVAPAVIGWTAEELLDGTPPLDRVHPDDRQRVLENWMATLSNPTIGHRSRARLLRNDGSHRWFELTNFNRLADPHRPCVVSELLDISEEMAAHEEVRAREQLLHRLAETLPLGVLQLDAGRRILYRNDLLCTIVGAEVAETMDEQFVATVDEDRGLLAKAFASALDNGEDDDVVIRMTPSGSRSERLIRVITKALRSDSGGASGVIACISDVTESELIGRELERRATHDALTGCRNRAAILTHLESAVSPGAGSVAVIFIDLDEFKSVNDRCGHAVGDEMLKAAATVIERTTRAGDCVGRLGGDEFVVVCTDVDDPSAAVELAARISAELRSHPTVLGSNVALRASIGVAWARRGTVSCDELVERADDAMYTSKRGGTGAPHLWAADGRAVRSA